VDLTDLGKTEYRLFDSMRMQFVPKTQRRLFIAGRAGGGKRIFREIALPASAVEKSGRAESENLYD